MAIAVSLSEGDLHGLVDGRLDAARRADALRALAASPADRARVDAWQEQNDLIRATFATVEKEALPLSMRLVSPPTLHCVPTPISTLHASPAEPPRRRRIAAGAAVTTLAFGGLFASWLMLQQAEDPQVADLGLRGPVDGGLAALASDAVADDVGARKSARAGAGSKVAAGPLPTTTIPDLSAAGFVFTRAENHALAPQALVFHYRNAAAEHVAVSVARSDAGAAETAPSPVGRTLTWQHGLTAYAVAGTVRPERLRSIATLLQASDVQD